MQICRLCQEDKPDTEFYPYASSGSNRVRRLTYECKSCLAIRNRVVQLRNWYGLTPGDYDDLLAFQGGKCAACDREFTESGGTRANIDHEHGGRTRGILCVRCNSLLGRIEDDVNLLRRLVQYLLLPPADELWDDEKVGLKQRNNRGSGYRKVV